MGNSLSQNKIDISDRISSLEKISMQEDKKNNKSALFRAIGAVVLTIATIVSLIFYMKTSGILSFT